MHLYEAFYDAFENLEQEKCIELVNDALKSQSISIEDLYENVLRMSMSHLTDVESDVNHKIWKEHIQSGIVRSVIEIAYPYVLNQRNKQAYKRAAVICPDGEQHELGARMVSDYIRMMGFETFFVGRDTPRKELFDLINTLNLDLIAISVTNYYNLSKAVQMVAFIEANFPNIKLIVGGKGFEMNPNLFDQNKIEITHTYEDIKRVLGNIV
jgi:methanogenic corrinoid protein MtbC1